MGAYTLLQDLTVATNSTSVVLNNFGTITKDDFIKIVFTLIDVSTGVSVGVLANSSVATNYHTQRLQGSGSTVSAARANNANVANAEGLVSSTAIMYLKLSQNDRVNVFSNDTMSNNSNIINRFFYMTSSGATFASGITSLTFTGNANIGTGSRIQIYKLAAEKVADFTVATNSTQVNIPFPTGTFSPAIDKDSEYLLVSDFTTTANTNFFLYINDNTTDSNYYVQFITGIGSTANASRRNDSLYASTNNGRSLVYSHIKLSNIGAFTAQNYGMMDTTSPTVNFRLRNLFISSTSEAITSITKLNIKSLTTSGINAGSRFTLYKLYE